MVGSFRRSFLLLLVLLGSAAAAVRPAGAAPLPVEVLTMTPGPHLFERFGHTALRVGDRVYNFGTFDGHEPQLVRKFLGHRLSYWLSIDTVEGHYARYANRTITVQALSLSEAEAEWMSARLEDNLRPENRAYRYDFFLDNCATRVRDAIDALLGGELRRGLEGQPGSATYRQHVERVLSPSPALAAGVSLLLNASTDRPLERWDEAFLPSELQAILAAAHRADGRPLVGRTTVWVGPKVATTAGAASRWTMGLGGMLLLPTLGAALLRGRGRRVRLQRALAGGGLALIGFVGGVLGVAVLVAALTPYPCAHGNASLLLVHPALLLLVPLGVLVARGRNAMALAAARWLLAASVAQIALDLLLHGLGVAHQAHLQLAVGALMIELLLLGSLLRIERAT